MSRLPLTTYCWSQPWKSDIQRLFVNSLESSSSCLKEGPLNKTNQIVRRTGVLGDYRETESSARRVNEITLPRRARLSRRYEVTRDENCFLTFLEFRCLFAIRSCDGKTFVHLTASCLRHFHCCYSIIDFDSGAPLVWTSCISWTWKVVCVDKRFVTMSTFFSACRQSRNLFIFTD